MKVPLYLFKSGLAHMSRGWVSPTVLPIVSDCRRVVHSHVDHNPQPNTQLWGGNFLPFSTSLLQAFASFYNSIDIDIAGH